MPSELLGSAVCCCASAGLPPGSGAHEILTDRSWATPATRPCNFLTDAHFSSNWLYPVSAFPFFFISHDTVIVLNSQLLRFSGKNQTSPLSGQGKKGAAASHSHFLSSSSTIYFTSLPCKQLNVLETWLSPALLCPAVIAASLRENWFPGMLCMHIPIWALHPHLPTR